MDLGWYFKIWSLLRLEWLEHQACVLACVLHSTPHARTPLNRISIKNYALQYYEHPLPPQVPFNAEIIIDNHPVPPAPRPIVRP